MDAVRLAEILKGDLARSAGKGDMLRAVRQFVMDVERSDDASALIAAQPATTGDERWDALIAGAVEYVAFQRAVTAPRWAVTADPLVRWWFVTDFPHMRATAFVETPPAVARHGVFLRRASLVNI